MTRKLTILLILLLFAFCIYNAWHFFNYGYPYTLNPTYNYIEGTQASETPYQLAQCASKQQTIKQQLIPLQQKTEALGNYLTHMTLPNNSFEPLYAQYHAMEVKLWQLESKESCA